MKFTNALALLGASTCAVSTNNDSLAARMENLGQRLVPDLQYPGDKCCYLYKHPKYYGERAKVCHEDERKGFFLWDELDGDWNDEISSYICGKNVWFNMCLNDEDGCNKFDLLSGAGHHKNPDIGQSSNKDFDNQITWMEMGPYEPSDVGAITLFEDPHCQGHATRVYWIPPTDDNTSIGGYYNSWDLQQLGMSKETKSSLMMPKGYKVDLLNGWNLETFEHLASLEGKYKNSRSQEMECRDLGELGINDRVNSLIITRSDNAVGQWQAITSTETQEYKFHVGINTSSSESSASEIQDQLTFAAELGFSYGFVSGSASVSKSLSETLFSDMQSTYGVDYGIENTTHCTAQGKEGAGMYQWVVSTRDAKYQTFTWHTVCRTGADFNIPPACPYGACLDAECKECADWAM